MEGDPVLLRVRHAGCSCSAASLTRCVPRWTACASCAFLGAIPGRPMPGIVTTTAG